ncbi:MAG: hypothetical protein ACOX0Z_02350 [Candidatus Nanosyncoccaceae bacterium]|jgi:hypothetical protein
MNRKNKPTYISKRRASNYNYGRNQNISAYESAIKLGPITSTLMIGLMVTVLGLIYLTQATRVTSYDYQLSQIDAKIAELSSQKSNLEIEKARLTSIQTLTGSTVAQNMTPSSSVDYVRN